MADKLERLIRKLKSADIFDRRSAIFALEKIRDSRAVETLINAMKDEDSEVQASAVSSLGRIGDPRAIKPLMSVLGDEDSEELSFEAKNAIDRIIDLQSPLLRSYPYLLCKRCYS